MSEQIQEPLLEVSHLSRYFTTKTRGVAKTVKAVDDVSFSVRRGETFGLVGESGLRVVRFSACMIQQRAALSLTAERLPEGWTSPCASISPPICP